MRYLSFNLDGMQRYGIVENDGVVELSTDFPEWQTMRDVIGNNGLDRLEKARRGRDISCSLEDIEFEIPVPDPEKIICVGVNYPARNEEYADEKAAPPYPSLFVRFPASLSGHLRPIERPAESEKLDYEGEIVLIIGRQGRHIPADRALDHVAGLSLCNEGTLRDWVRHAKFNVTQGKNFDRSGAMGPWMTRFTNCDQLADIEFETRVNGEIRQSDRTSRMIFSPSRIIEYISTFTMLKPGDVIITGTPVGSGARLDPPQYLVPGDVVEVEADGLGCLKNQVVGAK